MWAISSSSQYLWRVFVVRSHLDQLCVLLPFAVLVVASLCYCCGYLSRSSFDQSFLLLTYVCNLLAYSVELRLSARVAPFFGGGWPRQDLRLHYRHQCLVSITSALKLVENVPEHSAWRANRFGELSYVCAALGDVLRRPSHCICSWVCYRVELDRRTCCYSRVSLEIVAFCLSVNASVTDRVCRILWKCANDVAFRAFLHTI
jgi:hypothetical protein